MSKNVIEKLVTIEPQPIPPDYSIGGNNLEGLGPQIYTIYLAGMVWTRTQDYELAKIRREYIIEKLEKWFNENKS